MNIVLFSGRKGGTGKTTLAHLAAYGAVLSGVPGVVVHTDARAPLTMQGRPYQYIDGRAPEDLHAVLSWAQASAGAGLVVVDGAGNRPAVAELLAPAADLVLIPCGIGGEDAAMALADLDAMPGAWIIVNRWPMTPGHARRRKAEGYIGQLPAERILCRLGESASADRFSESDVAPWRTPSPRVNSAARRLFARVAMQLAAQ